MADERYARRTARVLLLDAHARVLLLRFGDPGEWLTPGGGVDDGEQLREAAARELWEEVGLAVGAEGLGPHVATASGYADHGWVKGLLRDDFFLHRVDTHQVTSPGLSRFEQRGLTGHRWWTAAELMSTARTVFPVGLGPLVDRLAAGSIPAEPVRLPWHL